MSLGSNAIILKNTLGISLVYANRLLTTPDSMLSEREISIKTKVLQKLGRKNRGGDQNTILVKIPPYPTQPKSMDEKAVIKAVKSAGFTVTSSIVDKRPGKESSVYTSPLSQPLLPIDFVIANQILQAGSFYKKWHTEINSLLVKAGNYMVSGGTDGAFFARVTSGFAKEVKCELPDWVSDGLLLDVADVFLPWASNEHTSLSLEGRGNLEYETNLVSSYGLPHPEYSKRDVIPVNDTEVNAITLMMEQADMLLTQITKGGQEFSDWSSSVEGRKFFVPMIKNKVEMIERDNWDRKVRPYFCFSAPLAYLFSQLWSAYSSGVVQADATNESISLIGLSWVGGGATKIISMIKAVHPGHARYTTYADDFFVMVRLKTGEIYLFFFDISQMDTSIASEIGTTAGTLVDLRLSNKGENDENFPNDFRYVLATWRFAAFHPEVLFSKGVVGKPKYHHLLSGVPGTSRVDEIASFIICAENAMENTFHDVEDYKDLLSRVPVFVERTKRLGFTVKDTTLEPQLFIDKETVVGPILGQTLFYSETEGEYFPGPLLPERAIASLIYPKRPIKKPNDKLAYSMIVAFGIAQTAGPAHDVVYHACKAIWQYGKEVGIIPDVTILNDESVIGFQGTDYTSMVFDEEGKTRDFPDQKTFRDMLFTTYKPAPINGAPIPDDILAEIERALAGLESGGQWGDRDEIDRLEKAAKGVIAVPDANAPKADVERMGIHISPEDLKNSVPGRRPVDKDLEAKKLVAWKKRLEGQAKAKMETKSINVGKKDKKDKLKKFRPVDKPKETSFTEKHEHKHAHVETSIETEERLDESARKQSGKLSDRVRALLSKRITALEDMMVSPTNTLTERQRNDLIEEINHIDAQLRKGE